MADGGHRYSATGLLDRRRSGLLALVLVGVGLRIHGLGDESLWNDEIASLHDAQALGPDVILEQLRVARPLYYVLLRPWIEVFGTSEVAMRSLSVMIGVATIPAVYYLGLELYGHRTAIVGAALLTFSRFHVRWSQDVRMYALLGLLATLSMLTFVRYLEHGDRRRRALYVATTAALVYTHLYGVLLLLAQAGYGSLAVLLDRFDDPDIAPADWVGTVGGIAAVSLPVALAVGATSVDVFSGDTSLVAWLGAPDPLVPLWVPSQHLYRTDEAGLVLVTIPIVVVLIALATYHDREVPSQTVLLASWFGGVVVLPFVVSMLVKPMLALRYTIAALPAVLMLVGRGMDRVMAAIDPVFVRRMALLGLVVVMLPPLATYYEEPQHAQWRDVVDYVEGEAGADDVVVLSPRHTEKNYAYYAQREDLRVVGAAPSIPSERLSRVSAGAGSLWVVASQNMEMAEMRRLHEALNTTRIGATDGAGDGHRVVASRHRRSFHKVGVVRYDVRPIGADDTG